MVVRRTLIIKKKRNHAMVNHLVKRILKELTAMTFLKEIKKLKDHMRMVTLLHPTDRMLMKQMEQKNEKATGQVLSIMRRLDMGMELNIILNV